MGHAAEEAGGWGGGSWETLRAGVGGVMGNHIVMIGTLAFALSEVEAAGERSDRT